MLETCAEFEIALHAENLVSQKTGIFAAELRFVLPGADVVRPPVWGPVTFDFARLRELELLPRAYGEVLGAFLREPGERRDLFQYACQSAAVAGCDLRIRLLIGPSASELHSLRWEMLSDPGSGAPLFTDPHRPFSRVFGTSDLRPVRLRPRGQIGALIVVANPSDAGRYRPAGGSPLAPIDVQGKVEAARVGLGRLDPTELVSGGTATFERVLSCLRRGRGYDILFLVCHGAIHEQKPRLWLEKPDGTADVIAGHDFVQRICELPEPPRLIVLVSCQSAGAGGAVELVHAIGPSLASTGIPAVVAMQGDIDMETAREFSRVLFENMLEDGRIDRAVAVARSAVRGSPRWWVPVLFLRIASGRLWYVPGAGDRGFDKWPAVVGSIESGKTLPILGPGMLESVIGDMRDLSQEWAVAHGFPGAKIQEEELPNVAQFLSVVQADEYLRTTVFMKGLHGRTKQRLQRLCGALAADARGALDRVTLVEILRAAGREQRRRHPSDPHRVLASLPLPVYLNANADDLLFDALAEAGRTPEREFCRWTPRAEFPPGVYAAEPDFDPTPERPLVYYLFGHLSDPTSIVLTLDDFLDHVFALTQDHELIPKAVRGALAKRALLFLGFRHEDGAFRTLFRLIVNQPGSGARRRFAHVAAQLEPDEGRFALPERARQFMERYFGNENITIYWGTVERFAEELAERCGGVPAGRR